MVLVTVVKRSRIVFPLVVGAALAMLAISEGAHWRSVRAVDDLAGFDDARADILNVQQGILAAEAGQRGYLLTRRREYLSPYATALVDIDKSFKRLDGYYATDATGGELLGRMRVLTEAKLAELTLAIRLYDEDRGAASNDIVLSAINKTQMEAIRALGTEMLQTLNQEDSDRRATLLFTMQGRRIGMALLTAVSLLALLLFLRRSNDFNLQEQRLKGVVQAERDRLEVEVTERTAQLTDLARYLQTAREDERQRLARNLHDELGALLTSAKLDAARIKSRLAGTAPEAMQRLAHLVQTLNQSIALGRSIIEDLRPSTLGNLGLVPTLEILGREFAAQSNITVECSLTPVKLNASAELMVFRLVQEAITNVSKYAQASQVWVSLVAHDGQAEVSVRDDGVGFDVTVPAKSGFGLMGMRFRVEAEGGKLVVASAPGKGTRVMVTLPESRTTAAA